MSYSGEIMDQCGVIEIDCSSVAVVAVRGDGPDGCSHLLIHTGPARGGYYFYVTELHGYPRYMNEIGYRRYLRETGKTEIRRRNLTLPDPQGASRYLEKLMASKWTWLVAPDDCVAFVEEVIRAGGGTWGFYSNCPDRAAQDTLPQRIHKFLNRLESAIYNLYGVPRL
jgi:hypothetical protein